ncbi:TetR/AcrR family transcriptional regulator [Hydrogenophaga sp. 5NK40-0174]|uniref:TetR/AcrR family transcriptional regulator n=1 Tax=Hydrogenophaga sp. 5NK40-0174 TaxID=3127649 RepID=UPI0031091DD5
MQVTTIDWLDAGLKALGEQGPQALRIEPLCKALGVTKGSFYHHFPHLKAYVDALLEHWVAQHTARLIDAVAEMDDPLERMQKLGEMAYGADMNVEVAIRAWGRSEVRAAQTVHRVDERRLDYLTEQGTQMGLPPAQAGLMAKMGYAQLIGVQHLQDHISTDDALAMDALMATLAQQNTRAS